MMTAEIYANITRNAIKHNIEELKIVKSIAFRTVRKVNFRNGTLESKQEGNVVLEGNLFHGLITRSQKKLARTPLLHVLKEFVECVSSNTGICVQNISCRNCETKHRVFLCTGITVTSSEPLSKPASATLMTITLLLQGTSTFAASSTATTATAGTQTTATAGPTQTQTTATAGTQTTATAGPTQTQTTATAGTQTTATAGPTQTQTTAVAGSTQTQTTAAPGTQATATTGPTQTTGGTQTGAATQTTAAPGTGSTAGPGSLHFTSRSYTRAVDAVIVCLSRVAIVSVRSCYWASSQSIVLDLIFFTADKFLNEGPSMNS